MCRRMPLGTHCVVVALILLVVPGFVSATTIGWATPSGWAGNGAKIYYWGDPPQWNGTAWVYVPRVQDVTGVANQGVNTGIYSDMVLPPPPPPAFPAIASGQAWADGYTLHSRLNSSGYSNQWEAGAFVRDELYFQTANAKPGVVELVFSVNGTATGDAYLNVLWQADPLNGGPNLSTPSSITGNFNEQLILRTSDLGYQVASGTYLPYTLAAWGWAQNGSLDWSDTITLTGVNAYQYDANNNLVQLTPDQFTIRSESGQDTFNLFEHTMPSAPSAPIPEPTSFLLLATGVVGLVVWRKRR